MNEVKVMSNEPQRPETAQDIGTFKAQQPWIIYANGLEQRIAELEEEAAFQHTYHKEYADRLEQADQLLGDVVSDVRMGLSVGTIEAIKRHLQEKK